MDRQTIFENGRRTLLLNLDLNDYQYLKSRSKREREPIAIMVRRMIREWQKQELEPDRQDRQPGNLVASR